MMATGLYAPESTNGMLSLRVEGAGIYERGGSGSWPQEGLGRVLDRFRGSEEVPELATTMMGGTNSEELGKIVERNIDSARQSD
jgi:hypothetical protein